MSEKLQQVILDPAAVALPGRLEVALMGGGLEVAKDGLDFGDAEFKQFLAEGEYGSRPIDGIWPSVSVKIPLIIRAGGGASFDDWRVKLEQKVADFNLDGGGQIKRVLPSGRFAYADITGAKLHLGAGWAAENVDFDREALLELQRLPDWYGEEVEGPLHEFTGDGSFTEVVKGTLPARVESLIVTDISGHDQKGLLWNFRGRNYDPAATAEWAYNVESLELLDLAEKATLSGSYGTKVVKHPNLSTEWTPVLGTTLAAGSFLTHVGVYDVWARVYTTSEKLPWLRLLWDLGDMVSPSENVQVQVPGREGLYMVYLGQVNLRELPFGAQRWKGVVYGRGEEGGENVSIDRLWLQCADECSGVLRAAASSSALPSVKASDPLTGTGALSGSSANRGGKWEESGDEDGFTRGEEGAERDADGDLSGKGRMAILSESTLGACTVRCQVASNVPGDTHIQAILLRYCDSTHWARLSLNRGLSGSLKIEYQAGGAVVSSGKIAEVWPTTNFYELEATLDADAVVTTAGVQYGLPATFRKGEPNGEGKVGIYDENRTITPIARRYRMFAASPPAPGDAVVYANRSAKLSTNGLFRESEDGAGYGPIAYPGADIPRLPASGPNEAPVEIGVKPSRGDTRTLTDAGKDAFKAQLVYRPCWSEIPAA